MTLAVPFVIAGLDPAIHEALPLADSQRGPAGQCHVLGPAAGRTRVPRVTMEGGPSPRSHNSFTGVGSRLKMRAAFSPRIFRLACSDRNGRSRISLGRSKSKCGQSDANSSWVSALIMSSVHSRPLRLVASIGCVVYQQ